MTVITQSIPLKTSHLSVGYRNGQSENVLFEGINLSLKPSTLTCFMGPNGIGKSTLIRVLAELQKPLAGEISISGEKKIALVLTDKITATNMTVWDLVSYGRYPYLGWGLSFSNYDYNVIEQAIKDVRIQELVTKKIEELS